MNHALRLSLVSASVLALAACGKGAKLGGGKEGAAAALFQASGPASGASGSPYNNSLGISQTITVKGSKGGSAEVTQNTNITGTGSAEVVLNVKYNNFSRDGKNAFNGQLAFTMKINVDTSGAGTISGNMSMSIVGKVTISGEIDDFVDANVTQTVDFASLSKDAGTVTVTLNGTIATSTESYSYNNETVTLTAGELQAAVKSS